MYMNTKSVSSRYFIIIKQSLIVYVSFKKNPVLKFNSAKIVFFSNFHSHIKKLFSKKNFGKNSKVNTGNVSFHIVVLS